MKKVMNKNLVRRKAQVVNIMRWITSKYVSVSTALEINNRNKELFTLAISEITRELVEVLPDQKAVIQKVIEISQVIKGLNSVKTLWDLKKGVKTLETVKPKEITVNADGEEDPRGETKLVYVPVSKTVKTKVELKLEHKKSLKI